MYSGCIRCATRAWTRLPAFFQGSCPDMYIHVHETEFYLDTVHGLRGATARLARSGLGEVAAHELNALGDLLLAHLPFRAQRCCRVHEVCHPGASLWHSVSRAHVRHQPQRHLGRSQPIRDPAPLQPVVFCTQRVPLERLCMVRAVRMMRYKSDSKQAVRAFMKKPALQEESG